MSCGNAQKVLNNRILYNLLAEKYGIVEKIIISEYDKENFDFAEVCANYDALAVCGGDGTFNSAINATRNLDIDLIYVPCGTLNDAAHTLRSIEFEGLTDLSDRRIRQIDLGEINNTLFTYVAACGTFTAIGYKAKSKSKKLLKRIIYYLHAIKEYRLAHIKARIDLPDKTLEGEYTLIMVVKSKYVFGLGFNKLYKHNSGTGHLLLIKTPKGLFKLIKMFLLFFRAFFIGFKTQLDTKNIKFIEFEKVSIQLESPEQFCVDGEELQLDGRNDVGFYKKAVRIFIP
jgi:diacylglycerol kinase family enzyme